jgi:hypothetical protein
MANTYEAIATVEVGSGGAANIEFTSIPGTYTDLAIAFSIRSANYVYKRLLGSGSAASSAGGDDYIIDVVQGDNATADTFGSEYIYIPNYAGSTYKSVSNDFVGENNGTLAYMGFMAFLWESTSAITSIKLSGNGSLKQYSSATLYGIKNS